MAAKFEILQPKAGEFRWVLSSQGRVLARSEAYTRKVSCVNSMESFRKAAPTAIVFDSTTASLVRAAAPETVTGKAARVTGRAVGTAAAKAKPVARVARVVAEAPVKAVEAAKRAVTADKAPRTRPSRAT
jgi:uncharacterized protein YegP (UPF0339 family)